MWKVEKNYLCRSFIFNTFIEALAFINKVGLLAEKQGHHPEIWNVYNRVKISLNTHDAGNIITRKDRMLANAIDKLYINVDPAD